MTGCRSGRDCYGAGLLFRAAPWYGRERRKAVAAGVERGHMGFNCPGIAGYVLDLVGAGKYSAPWMGCNVCRLSDAGLVLCGDFPGWET